MYCITFSSSGRDFSASGREAEPSGRCYQTMDQHVAALDSPSLNYHIHGKEPTCIRPSRQDPGKLLAASSEVIAKHGYGNGFDKNNSRFKRRGERSRRIEREYETESSVFLNKPEQHQISKFQDKSPVLGMELFFEPDERHEDEMAEKNRRRREKDSSREKSPQQLAKELRTTSRLLECERSQRQALSKRLDNMDSQLKQLKKSQPRVQPRAHRTDNKNLQIEELNTKIQGQQAELDEQLTRNQQLQEEIESVKAQNNNLQLKKSQPRVQPRAHRTDNKNLQIEELNAKIQGQQAELDVQLTRNQQLQEEIESVKAQNNNLNHQMRLLMFQHIPLVSSKFKDIGSVDYDVKEDWAQVSDYQLGKKIGEGHYGTVQRGTDLVSKKDYAVKILNKERMTRFKDLQQIAMEVHVLKHYTHPNIIRLKEVVHAPENIYLIMELCSMDLHSYHAKIGLSEDAAKQVVFGILQALNHLHGNGICHLDLKPENVLLTQSADLKSLNHEHIRLCDFGLVNMVRKPDRTKDIVRKGYACGTPGFFAPEMILKKEFEGRSADMWSLGAIILEITLGFTHEWIESYNKIDSDARVFQKGLQGCLAEIPKERYPLHQKLLAIIHSCLSIEPADRISSKEALHHPWLSTLTGFTEHRQDYQEPPVLDCCDPRPPTFPDLL